MSHEKPSKTADLRKLVDEAEVLTNESSKIYLGAKSFTPVEAIKKLVEAVREAADRIDELEKRVGKDR